MFSIFASVKDVIKELKNKKLLLKEVPDEVGAEAANELKNNLIEVIQAENYVASGDLIESIQTRYSKSVKNNYAAVSYRVGSKDPAATIGEYGRKPGSKRPPSRVIYQWMIDKGWDDPSKSLAWYIAGKIAKEGIRPRRIFTQAIEASKSKIKSMLDKTLRQKLK